MMDERFSGSAGGGGLSGGCRKHFWLVLALLGMLLWLYGCGKTRVSYVPRTQPVPHADTGGTEPSGQTVEDRLLAHYARWKTTPYKNGGLSKRGVDCSGFVLITYRDLFGTSLPRTVEEQEKIAREIRGSDRRVGDLLFFKTGLFSRHVGIWLGDSRFLHASTSRGVTISNLTDEYWQDHYWKTGRIVGR